jgi:hypothetical protein
MAVPALRERFLESTIRVRYFLGPATKKPYLEILVIKYSGTYPHGSAGNADAQFPYAMAKAGVAAFEPWGVIHDLTELSYEWGDMLERVLAVGPDKELPPELESVFGSCSGSGRSPVAVVVGPHCEEAIRTLLLGERNCEPIEKIGYVFRDLQSAWAHVDAQIS